MDSCSAVMSKPEINKWHSIMENYSTLAPSITQMRSIVILNPNTSRLISDLLQRRAEVLLNGAMRIRVLAAPFGSPALRNAADLALAEKAVIAMANRLPPNDGVIVGAFGDPGLSALREAGHLSVAGLGKSGYRAAAAQGRFAILTLGRDMEDAIRLRAAQLGAADRLTECHFLPEDIPTVAARPEDFRARIEAFARAAAGRGAQALLLGGAPFSGMAMTLPSGFPVLDGLSSAIAQLSGLAKRSGGSDIGAE